MRIFKNLALLSMLVSACATPGFAQIYWSNQSPAGITDDIWCVAYANGTFAAVTNQGNLLTSTNGLTWSSQSIDSGVWLVSIAYGNGMWVVVGDKGTIMISSDLHTWATVRSGTTNKLNGVSYSSQGLYDGTSFVAVGDGGTILTSPDAQNWTIQTSGVTGFLHGITYIQNVYLGPLAQNHNAFVISGQYGVLLASAESGSGFYPINSGTSQNLEAVFSESLLPLQMPITVAVGANGTIVYGSNLLPDANPFFNDTTSSITTATFRGLTYGNGFFVAAGEQGTIMTSPDGKVWTQRFSGDSPTTVSTAALLCATYSEQLQRFVVTGTGGTILMSNSVPTVFGNVSTRGYVSSTQIFIGGFVIEGTAPRTVLIRADGPALTTFSVPSPLPDPVLTVYDNNGKVVATNTGWTTNTNPASISMAALEVGAFALPNPSPDSALLLTLQPGAYTAQITSAKGNSGIVLFEAYTD